MKAIVTGAGGAIGMALVGELRKRGDSVLVLMREGSRGFGQIEKAFGDENVTCAVCDLASLGAFDVTPYGKFDAFFHLAWEGTTGEDRMNAEMQNANVTYALDAAALAKRAGCSVFLGAGSQAEYGPSDEILTPDSPTFPETEYGRGKLRASYRTRAFCSANGIRHVWARILSVYGPYDRGGLIVPTVRKLLAGEVPETTKGEQVWDFLYSADAARALVLLAEKGEDGKVYPLGSGKAVPLRETLEKVVSSVRPGGKIAFGKIPYAKNQTMFLCADIGELTRDTGFLPEVGIEEGSRRIAEWLAEEKER